jgi:hypothetical protein
MTSVDLFPHSHPMKNKQATQTAFRLPNSTVVVQSFCVTSLNISHARKEVSHTEISHHPCFVHLLVFWSIPHCKKPAVLSCRFLLKTETPRFITRIVNIQSGEAAMLC